MTIWLVTFSFEAFFRWPQFCGTVQSLKKNETFLLWALRDRKTLDSEVGPIEKFMVHYFLLFETCHLVNAAPLKKELRSCTRKWALLKPSQMEKGSSSDIMSK
ncbi:hypothetical protein V8G54_017013 [Vigna mungo]|uniref:Uncharacterized protein n=1 Tax=Vigna mungo TaxID=3915 RepID=A0AAQ3S0Z1_VIGMU